MTGGMLIRRFITQRKIAQLLLRPVLALHTFAYKLVSVLAIAVEGGVHPKHRLLAYEAWFTGGLREDDVVVDIGSNVGTMVRAMAARAAFVYGVEMNEKHHVAALSGPPGANIEFIHADATVYDYRGLRPITVVTLSNVLEHIEHRREFLEALVDRLPWAKGARKRFLIRVPMLDREWVAVYKKEKDCEWRLDPTHYTEFTMAQLRDELAEAGIRIDSAEVRFGEAYAVCSVSDGAEGASGLQGRPPA
jgi:hypothetical protein